MSDFQLDWGWSGGTLQEQLKSQNMGFVPGAPAGIYEQCRELLAEMKDFGWISAAEKTEIIKKIMEHLADHVAPLGQDVIWHRGRSGQ